MCGRFQSKRDQKVFIPTSFSLMASNSAAKELVCWGLFSKLLPSSNPLFSIAACNSSLFSWNPEMDKFLGENIFSHKLANSLLFASLRVRISDSISAILAGKSPVASSMTSPAPSSSTTTPRLLLRLSSASRRPSSTSRLSSCN